MTITRNLRTVTPTITASTRRVRLTVAPLAVNDAPAQVGSTVTGPHTAAGIARAVIGSDITECLLAIFLDARNRVTGYSEIARGTLNAARFAPRDVFVPALHANAAAVIVAHNHPSGDATPSRADRTATVTLRNAARLIGLPIADHLIVTPRDVWSFRERDRWDDTEIAGDTTKDANALDAIAAVMSGAEWDPDTLDTIAGVVRATGRVVADVADDDPEDEDHGEGYDCPECFRRVNGDAPAGAPS